MRGRRVGCATHQARQATPRWALQQTQTVLVAAMAPVLVAHWLHLGHNQQQMARVKKLRAVSSPPLCEGVAQVLPVLLCVTRAQELPLRLHLTETQTETRCRVWACRAGRAVHSPQQLPACAHHSGTRHAGSRGRCAAVPSRQAGRRCSPSHISGRGLLPCFCQSRQYPCTPGLAVNRQCTHSLVHSPWRTRLAGSHAVVKQLMLPTC